MLKNIMTKNISELVAGDKVKIINSPYTTIDKIGSVRKKYYMVGRQKYDKATGQLVSQPPLYDLAAVFGYTTPYIVPIDDEEEEEEKITLVKNIRFHLHDNTKLTVDQLRKIKSIIDNG